MTDNIVELVKEKNPIQDVIEEDGYPLPKRGRYRKCTRAGTGGLVIDVQRQTFHWNARGEWGDVIAWVMGQRRTDFKAAVDILCRRANLPEPEWSHADQVARIAARAREEALDVAVRVFRRWLERSADARLYAASRGWSDWQPGEGEDTRRPGTIQRAMLGYSGEGTTAEREEMAAELRLAGADMDSPIVVAILGKRGSVAAWAKAQGVELDEEWLLRDSVPGMIGHKRLVYPHVRNGRVVYLSGRSIDAKLHFNLPVALAGGRQPYFNHVYAPAGDELVVVEGQADAVSLGQLGIPAVALAGVAADEQLADSLTRHKVLYVGLDADSAGQTSGWKVADLLGPLTRMVGWKSERHAHWLDREGQPQEIKDANDLLRALQQAGLSAEDQDTALRRQLEAAPVYVQALAEWAADQGGAARDAAQRRVLEVAARMDDFDLSQRKKQLGKALGVGVRDFDRMLKALKAEAKKAETSAETVYTLGGWIGGHLVEYLYDPEEHRSRLAWRDPDGRLHEGERVEIDGVVYGAMPATQTLRDGGVIFPSRLGPVKPTREVVAYLESFIASVYLLSRRTDAKIMAYYALLTWLYDSFNTIPYLRAMGEAGAGKSELMRRVGLVCYRLMSANGAGTASSLFRSVERYRGTVLIDEADLRDSDTTNDIVKFLNLGAMRNNPIWRLEEVIGPDGKKEFVERTFQTFCPKLIAMRKDFRDDAVGSRSITFKIQPRETEELLAAGVPLEITGEIRARAQALRNILVTWRLTHWQPEIEIDPAFYDIYISSRLNQVTGPLMAVAKDDPELQAEMRRFLQDYYREMVVSRSMTITARVIEALWRIRTDPRLRETLVVANPDGSEQIKVGEVTRVANEIIDEQNSSGEEEEEGETKKRRRDELSPHRIGRIIREELQLAVGKRGSQGFFVTWDEVRMSALAKRYGVNPGEVQDSAQSAEAPKKPVQETIPF